MQSMESSKNNRRDPDPDPNTQGGRRAKPNFCQKALCEAAVGDLTSRSTNHERPEQ